MKKTSILWLYFRRIPILLWKQKSKQWPTNFHLKRYLLKMEGKWKRSLEQSNLICHFWKLERYKNHLKFALPWIMTLSLDDNWPKQLGYIKDYQPLPKCTNTFLKSLVTDQNSLESFGNAFKSLWTAQNSPNVSRKLEQQPLNIRNMQVEQRKAETRTKAKVVYNNTRNRSEKFQISNLPVVNCRKTETQFYIRVINWRHTWNGQNHPFRE